MKDIIHVFYLVLKTYLVSIFWWNYIAIYTETIQTELVSQILEPLCCIHSYLRYCLKNNSQVNTILSKVTIWVTVSMLLQTFNRQMILRIHYLFLLFQVFNDTENSLFICVIPSFQWYWEFIIYLCYSKFSTENSWFICVIPSFQLRFHDLFVLFQVFYWEFMIYLCYSKFSTENSWFICVIQGFPGFCG